MTKLKLLACAAIAAFGAAACASSGDGDNASASSNASSSAAARTELAPTQPSAAEATSGYSDAQIQAFAAASLEIDPINRTLPGASPDQQATAATQIRAILERNNLDGNTYNAIATRAQTDTALAARIAAAQTGQPQSETGEGPATEPESAPTQQ